MRNAIIAATGAYVPERVVSNQWFNALLGEDVDSWLRQHVEIYNRRWAAPEESTVDLCEKAALQALERAGIAPAQLDLLIVATDTPEYISPSTASKLQHRLGAVNAGTFDLNSACAGFVTALDVAGKYIKADGRYGHVLVIGAYAMSKHLNLQDKKTVTLFADGAGAVLLSAREEGPGGILASDLRTQGQYADWMGIYAGGSRTPLSGKVLEEKTHCVQFVQRFPTELNPGMWTDMARTLSQRSGVGLEEVALFALTQINVNAIRQTMRQLGQPADKAPTIMHEYGYTGSACIPMVLDQAVQSGRLKRGEVAFLIGSGGGLSFAGLALQY